jgi:hypothetical protein
MPKDPYIRENFTREHPHARKLAKEYFERYPKDRFQTEVESWRYLKSANINDEATARAAQPVKPTNGRLRKSGATGLIGAGFLRLFHPSPPKHIEGDQISGFLRLCI